MNLYYWKAKPNFGDLLSTLLVKHFTGLDSQWSTPRLSELIVVGSILEHMPKRWGGVIAGAGKLKESTTVDFPNANILALRGPLTAKGLAGNFAIGDPALLADELVPLQDKQYNLGIVQHWSDKSLETNPLFTQYKPHIINVGHDPLKVITEISKCKKIVSSSLHGIILADAFGIPRRIEIPQLALDKPEQEGGLFKWQDYNASINLPFKVGVTQEADRHTVADRQSELFDVFQEIKFLFRLSHE